MLCEEGNFVSPNRSPPPCPPLELRTVRTVRVKVTTRPKTRMRLFFFTSPTVPCQAWPLYARTENVASEIKHKQHSTQGRMFPVHQDGSPSRRCSVTIMYDSKPLPFTSHGTTHLSTHPTRPPHVYHARPISLSFQRFWA